MAKVLGCDLEVLEFELYSWYYVVHFRDNILGNVMNPLYLLSRWLNNITTVYLELIDPVGSVFAYGLGDLGSIPVRVIPKTLKMVLDTSLFYTQQYKVRIKDKVEQSRERSSALPYTLV